MQRPSKTLVGNFPINPMENLRSKYCPIMSQFRGPFVYNMADDGDPDPDEGGESPDSDDPDAPDPNTPEGKKWKQLKEEKKAAEEAAAQAEAEKLKAEAQAEGYKQAMDDFKAGVTEPKKKEEEVKPPVPTNPDDEAYVEAIMRKKGFDPEQMKKDAEEAKRQSYEAAARQALNEACAELEKEFEGSVPFDRKAVLEYARENKYGIAMPNADVAHVLRLAHRAMNEEAFTEYAIAQKSDKKKAPQMEHSGSGGKVPPEAPEEEADGETVDDFRKAAKEAWEEGQV